MRCQVARPVRRAGRGNGSGVIPNRAPVRPLHHRPEEPVGDRHPGGADHQLHDAAAPARRYTPELVRDALAAKIETLPEILRASLTWDQGPEMGKWKQVSVDADIDIFFCDPHAPWQRCHQ